MIIKKYIATTEKEAVSLAKAELGEDVTIMNIKENNPKGLSRLFKKSSVEVTAAIDDVKTESKKLERKKEHTDFAKLQQALDGNGFTPAPDSKTARMEENKERLFRNNQVIRDNVVDVVGGKMDSSNEIEQKLNTLQDLIEKQMAQSIKDEQKANEQKEDKNQGYLELIKKQLLQNEVEAVYIDQIMDEIKGSLGRNVSLDNVLASVYQKIVLKIGQPHMIDTDNEKTKFIFFIGPTGVGKTTTIAKIASTMKLSKKLKVALVTSDTYRIAAVEQLRTYANILSIPLKVVYTAEEMESIRDELLAFDIVLIEYGRPFT